MYTSSRVQSWPCCGARPILFVARRNSETARRMLTRVPVHSARQRCRCQGAARWAHGSAPPWFNVTAAGLVLRAYTPIAAYFWAPAGRSPDNFNLLRWSLAGRPRAYCMVGCSSF
jgi:hypothetical protein